MTSRDRVWWLTGNPAQPSTQGWGGRDATSWGEATLRALGQKAWHLLPNAAAGYDLFALRLDHDHAGLPGEPLWLGSLVPTGSFAPREQTASAWLAVGRMALTASGLRREAAQNQSRVDQLTREHQALREMHAELFQANEAIRESHEKEQKLRDEHLESELAIRSADMRQALERANSACEANIKCLAALAERLGGAVDAIAAAERAASAANDASGAAAPIAQAMEQVRRQGLFVRRVLQNARLIGPLAAGIWKCETAVCDPSSILTEVVDALRITIGQKRTALILTIDPGVPTRIVTIPEGLAQAAFNLIDNAIRFTLCGEVRVAVTAVRGQLRITVSDSGVGLSRRQLEDLFQPFTQAGTSTTPSTYARGLGLEVAYRLAERMGGSVTAVSTPAKGSQFTLCVSDESSAREGAAPLAKTPVEAPRPKTGPRVLVVEDTPDTAMLMRLLLTAKGFAVELAGDGRSAVDSALAATAAGRAFDVILMDMQLPVLDGYAATMELRRRGHCGPIIALTAHAMTGDRERCIDAGCDDYMTKPVDAPRLTQAIRDYASGQRKPRHTSPRTGTS